MAIAESTPTAKPTIVPITGAADPIVAPAAPAANQLVAAAVAAPPAAEAPADLIKSKDTSTAKSEETIFLFGSIA